MEHTEEYDRIQKAIEKWTERNNKRLKKKYVIKKSHKNL